MILLISATFPPEPVVSASLANDLALALSEITDVKVLSPRPSRPQGFSFEGKVEKRKEYEHIVLKSFIYPKSKVIGRMAESFSFGRHSALFIKKNYSYIRCIYVNAWPLLAQYLIVKAAKKHLITVILHIQDIYPESLSDKLGIFKRLFIKCLLPMDKYILRNSAKVVTLSPTMKKYLINTRALNEDNMEVVYNWQDEGRFITYRKSTNIIEGHTVFTFMFLGNLNPTASLDLVINAFGKCKFTDSLLVIAGSGSERDHLLTQAQEFPGAKIEFWDAQFNDVPEIQDKADVLILNLRKGAARFALPSKLTAYMFSAKPIIACVDEDSDTAGLINQAYCGWVIPPENENRLIEAMNIAISITPEERETLGTNGYKFALENFSRLKNLKRVVNIIESSASQ